MNPRAGSKPAYSLSRGVENLDFMRVCGFHVNHLLTTREQVHGFMRFFGT